MTVMIIGLVLFIGIHLVPVAQPLRIRLVARMGDGPYRGLFAAVAGVGLILIVAGYYFRPDRVQLFAPFPAARAAAPTLVTIAFVLLASANMRTHLRSIVRHPMLIGLMLWSGVHLLANGDLAGTILFGSFFAYSLVALASAISRSAVKVFEPEVKYDLMAAAVSFALAYLIIRFHPALFGTGTVA